MLIPHAIELSAAPDSIPEQQLLDVGISLFDPGVPEGTVDKDVAEELLRDGVYIHIRRAESVYMAVELRSALERSGQWGNVLITPEPSSAAADLDVQGRILQSDGDIVRIAVRAVDALGREWLDKEYEFRAPAAVYNMRRYPHADPYQDLFHMVANDLAAARARLPGRHAERIRTVAELRYARALSPAAFDGYIERDGDEFLPVRLPAVDDPMFSYARSIRQREQLFLETLDQHYESFAYRARDPYGSWRAAAREESMAIRELKRSVRWRRALGVAAVVASIATTMNGGIADDPTGRLVQDSLMMMGAGVLEMSNVRMQESRLHADLLQEVSESFEDEVKPLVVEIEGTEHRLTGTAEMQYAEWRELLQRIFAEQTGLRAGPAGQAGPARPIVETRGAAARCAAKLEAAEDRAGGERATDAGAACR